MSIRNVCLTKGHHFVDNSGMVYCARWFCDATAVAIWAPPAIAASLHNAIPDDRRFPPQKIEES